MRRFVLLCLLSGCASSPPPQRPTGGPSPVDPPAVYEVWWSEVEDCMNEYEPFAEVTFYTVPGDHVGDDPDRYGEANVLFNTITMAERWVFLEDGVKHEMAHLLDDYGGHRTPPFDVCAPRWVMRPD